MSLYRRGSVWHYDFQERGRRYWGSTKRTNKREAQRYLMRLRAEIYDRRDGSAGSTSKTLREVVNLYEAERLPALKNESLIYTHRRLMEHLGERTRFDELTAAVLNRYIDARRAAGTPDNTIRHDVSRVVALKNWLRGAYPSVRLAPDGKILVPKSRRRIRILNSREEETALWDALADRPQRAFELATLLLDTGLRFGEAARLTWDSVYLDDARLRVFRHKTGNTSRLGLTDRVVSVLEGIRRRQPRSCPYVFPKEDMRRPMARQYPPLSAAIEASGINADHITAAWGKFTPHSFRHTFGTRLVKAGVNLVAIQAMMGHADIKSTMIYVHLAAEDGLKDAVDALNALNQRTESPDEIHNVHQLYERASA